MCSIAGIAGYKDETGITRMLKATSHRGPDDHGMFTDDLCTLGHNRLSIMDLSDAGHQPMISDDGQYILVYNGELYNCIEHRQDLMREGVIFHSRTDTEVLLHLYMRHGERCVELLEGMFAFAVWDVAEQKLFCARDRFGIKPLYYTFQNNCMSFCSELKGLMEVLPQRHLNEQALHVYLMLGYVPAPLTMLEGVHSLNAGYSVTWKNGSINLKPFASKPKDIPPQPNTYEEALITIRQLLGQSVKQQLISDVPVGLFLSGGLDSTIIALLASEAESQHNLNSYTICFDGIDNESTAASETARYYGTRHHEIFISGDEVSEDFDRFIQSLDQPSTDGLNSYLISKYSRKDMKVALSGLGGDELFFGYNWQFHLLNSHKGKSNILPKQLLPFFATYLPKAYKKMLHHYATGEFPILYSLQNNVWDEFETSKLTGSSTPYSLRDSLCKNLVEAGVPQNGNLSTRIHESDSRLFMGARLREGDSTSMSHSLEVRFPILDGALFDYVNQLPDEWRLPDYRNQSYEEQTFGKSFHKKMLYDSFSKLLPPGFNQRQKRGFKLPHSSWMKGNMRKRITECLISSNGITEMGLRQSSWEKFLSGHESWNRPWSLFVLQEWCNKFQVSR
jgi:asparagine synthase (glutamine-hydrolysing)